MSIKKISQLNQLSKNELTSSIDLLAIVDTTNNETKNITVNDLLSGSDAFRGIFTDEGSYYSTTNDLQVTGSFTVKGDITGSNISADNIIFSPTATSIKVEAPDKTTGNQDGAEITIESGDAFGSNYKGGDLELNAGKGSGGGLNSQGGDIIISTFGLIGAGSPEDSGSIILNGDITASNSISASGDITANSFIGDGSQITNVLSEWDGTRDGDAEITGSLIITKDIDSNLSPTDSQLLVASISPTGSDGVVRIRGHRNANTTINPSQLIFENYDSDLTSTNQLGLIGTKITNITDNYGDLVFYTYPDGSTPTERLRINHTGSVGIDNPTPNALLDIGDGTSNTTGSLLRFNTERAWHFQSSGSSTNSALALVAEVSSKAFKVQSIDQLYTPLEVFTTQVSESNLVKLVQDGGMVGIGTPNPLSKLHVSGSTLIQGSNNQDFIKQEVNSTTSTLSFGNTEGSGGRVKWEYNRSSGVFSGYIGTNASTNFANIKANGNIGFGTTSPSSRVEIKGDSLSSVAGDSTDLFSMGAIAGVSNYDRILTTHERLSTGSTWTTAALRMQRNVDVSKMGYIQFGSNTSDLITFGENERELMRINGLGLVGIGTTNPLGNVHISGSGLTNFYIQSSNNDASIEIKSGEGNLSFIDFSQGPPNQTFNNGRILYSNSTDIMYFGTDERYRMVINGQGKVGIGGAVDNTVFGPVTPPLALLDIGNGEEYTDYTKHLRFNTERAWSFQSYNDGGNTELLLVSEVNNKTFRIQNSSGTNTTDIITFLGKADQGGDNLVTIPGNGRVSIGTSTTEAKLRVYSGSLGEVGDNSNLKFEAGGASSNQDRLQIQHNRISSGIDWNTAALRIQRKVDTTKMGYIEFGNHNDTLQNPLSSRLIAFGKDDTEYMSINGDGNLKIDNLIIKRAGGNSTLGENGHTYFPQGPTNQTPDYSTSYNGKTEWEGSNTIPLFTFTPPIFNSVYTFKIKIQYCENGTTDGVLYNDIKIGRNMGFAEYSFSCLRDEFIPAGDTNPIILENSRVIDAIRNIEKKYTLNQLVYQKSNAAYAYYPDLIFNSSATVVEPLFRIIVQGGSQDLTKWTASWSVDVLNMAESADIR